MPLQEIEETGPQVILILSGKRKCGKDYIANYFIESFGEKSAVVIRLSGPLKERYALENNLDYGKLLESSEYKEVYRHQMITWGENIRNKDPGYFCRHAIQQSQAVHKKIWIVSDSRRKTDLQYFLTTYPEVTHTVRISASESVRKERGWTFKRGVDDSESECDLDDYQKWDFQILNNDREEMLQHIQDILNWVRIKTT